MVAFAQLPLTIKTILLASSSLLTGNSPPRPPLGPGVGAGPLSMDRQVSSMTHTPVATNLLEAFNIQTYFTTQVTFYYVIAINRFT
jgi:hypothetical protein